MYRQGMLVGLVFVALAGCSQPGTSTTSDSAADPANDPAQVVDQLLPNAPQVLEPEESVPPTSPDAEMVREKANVGVGKAGKNIEPGLGRTAIKTYFVAQEAVVFRVEIPKALSLYKAIEGQAPKTHEDFMAKIIKANRIKLPELPDGHEYVYDPEKEELFVEQPK